MSKKNILERCGIEERDGVLYAPKYKRTEYIKLKQIRHGSALEKLNHILSGLFEFYHEEIFKTIVPDDPEKIEECEESRAKCIKSWQSAKVSHQGILLTPLLDCAENNEKKCDKIIASLIGEPGTWWSYKDTKTHSNVILACFAEIVNRVIDHYENTEDFRKPLLGRIAVMLDIKNAVTEIIDMCVSSMFNSGGKDPVGDYAFEEFGVPVLNDNNDTCGDGLEVRDDGDGCPSCSG